jgi:hypothetical protein
LTDLVYISGYMTTQLLHEESHKFLTDIGFVARPILGQTSLIVYDYPDVVSVNLNKHQKVTNFRVLFRHINEDAYERGREQGKTDAISALMKNFTKLIYDKL